MPGYRQTAWASASAPASRPRPDARAGALEAAAAARRGLGGATVRPGGRVRLRRAPRGARGDARGHPRGARARRAGRLRRGRRDRRARARSRTARPSSVWAAAPRRRRGARRSTPTRRGARGGHRRADRACRTWTAPPARSCSPTRSTFPTDAVLRFLAEARAERAAARRAGLRRGRPTTAPCCSSATRCVDDGAVGVRLDGVEMLPVRLPGRRRRSGPELTITAGRGPHHRRARRQAGARRSCARRSRALAAEDLRRWSRAGC